MILATNTDFFFNRITDCYLSWRGNVFPVKYGPNFYILLSTNPVHKVLTKYKENFISGRLQSDGIIKDFYLENINTKIIIMWNNKEFF
jgi:hypothetical protein